MRCPSCRKLKRTDQCVRRGVCDQGRVDAGARIRRQRGATILVGFKRGSGFKLAAHLTNDRDNDHVERHGLRGFSSDPLRDALQESEAIAKRAGKKTRVIIRAFREACTYSDSAAGFVRALEEKDYVLARGDRGG